MVIIHTLKYNATQTGIPYHFKRGHGRSEKSSTSLGPCKLQGSNVYRGVQAGFIETKISQYQVFLRVF